jgi:hypothetical protein
MFCNFRPVVWLVATAFLFLHLAFASDLPRLSFNDLTDNSELIVSGKVTRAWTDWDADHKYIWSHYELAVSATFKGTTGQTVDIAEPGGDMDGMVMKISGTTGYRVGDNVVVFLSRMPNGFLRTAGFGQGKFMVDAKGLLRGTAALKAEASAPATVRSLDGLSVGQVSQLVDARVRPRGRAQ